MSTRPRRLWSALASLGLLAILAVPALAGVLEGPGPERRVPGVVWVDSLPTAVAERLERGPRRWFWQRRPPEPPAPRITIRGGRFRPALQASPVGGEVVIANEDRLWHGVFSMTSGHVLDRGKRPPGSLDTLRATRAGRVQLRCDLHAEESSWWVVTPSRAYALTDSTGRWRLPDLPAGRYALRAWRPGGRVLTRTVEVPRRGTAEVRWRW